MSRYHYGIEGKHHYWRMFLMMIWNCLCLVAISIFFSFEVHGGGVVVTAFGIISNIQTPTHHHYQRSTSASASIQHHGQKTPRTSTILNYQQNDEDDDTSIHETVMELDPLWYQEYVTDILGKDYCKSKWPILPKEKKGSNADELSEVALSAETDVSNTKQETIEAETPDLIEEEKEKEDQSIQPLVTTLEVQEESQTKLDEDELEVKEAKLTEKESITLDKGGGQQTVELEVTAGDEIAQQPDETEKVLTPKSTGDSSEERKGSVDSLMESTWKGMTQSVFGGGGSSSKDISEDKMEVKAADIKETSVPQSQLDLQTAKKEQKLKEPAATVPNATATVKGEIPSTEIVSGEMNKASDEDSKDDNASSKKSIDAEGKDNDDDDVDDDRVALYRTFGGRVKSFPLSNLINLGYRPEEIEQMESDALYVIIQDKVKRPRFGVPSQWKIQPGQRPEVKLVAKKNKESREEEEFDLKESGRQQKQDEDSRGERRPVAAQSRRKPPASTTRISKGSSDDDRIASKKTIQEMTPARDNLVEETESKANNKDDMPEPEVKTVDSSADSIGAAAAMNESIVVYRNIAGDLTTAPLQSLTDLGYKKEEVLSMISDALAVVIADNVTRPRRGVPPQWKVPKGAQLEDVQIVDNMNRAKPLLEADRAEKRRRKAVDNESIVGKPRRRRSSAEVDLDEANDGYNSRRRRDAEQGRRSSSSRGDYPSKSVIASDEDDSVTRSQRVPSDNEDVEEDVLDGSAQRRKRSRERNRNIDDDVDRRRESDAAPGGTRWRNEVSEDDRERSRGEVRRSRRRERSSINTDGTPKKIYNAREQLGRKNLPVKADPPNPNSKLWVDIDTFRDLLRTEAKLRLMFLPESWASTVKQESDWRLNLYKEWLWTLHDGVGESIVPPSRYERARRTARFRTDDEEEIRSASPRPKQRRRKPPPQKTKSRSGDRY